MNYTTAKRLSARGFKSALALSASFAMFAAAPALAQDADAEDEAEPKDEVVVTGSRIGRSALDAPQPLIQLGGEDIIISGEPNIVDFLADVPALQGSTVPEDTTGAGLGDGGL